MATDIIKACSAPLAMVVAGGLGWYALSQGVDGALFATVIAVVGGLGGYEVKSVVESRKAKTQEGKGTTKTDVQE